MQVHVGIRICGLETCCEGFALRNVVVSAVLEVVRILFEGPACVFL